MSRLSAQGARLCRQTFNHHIPILQVRRGPIAIQPYTKSSQHRPIQGRTWQPVYNRCYATATVSTAPGAPAEATVTANPQKKAVPDLAKLSAVVEQTRNRFLSAGGIPADQLTLVALKTCQTAANAIKPYLNRKDIKPPPNASSTLLALDGNGSKNATKVPQKESTRMQDTASTISKVAYEIVESPNVVLTPEILELYVDIQSSLGRPSTIPEVFSMFGSKPLPKKSGNSVVYKKQSPNRSSAAIELDLASKALDAAVAAKDLDAAIGIVETCYMGQPFVKQKLIRTMSLPALLALPTPFAVYAISAQFAHLHDNIDPVTMTKVTFALGMAYVVFTSSLGLIAKATVMDQMVRVTWAPGIPLRERWLREEERAALDKIAMAWGFKETWRHGEEGGLEWACLREYIGQKGMVLDRIDFMEGMN
ncbi:hypothetical protein jhhlp_007376 [Lomentospora prolificans]|uniref:Uncharacterized protein n=1 Tax=Lomentospora prolificans TaxID=41688 RepID=A0A2N3N2I4_9PEZI|nr:hypothetical protein jhhlp_007376 [Lomentospora prolificans]